jgi:nitrous oxidase accessory protein
MIDNLVKKGLVFAIIVLFISISINPSSAVDNVNKPSILVSDDNTLYVGGNGPDNYTRIQDAIDNASYGDWIYVYSGDYHESLIIYKTLRLIGENQESTKIYGDISVREDNVEIRGFTITQSTVFDNTKNCSILSCLIHSSYVGVKLSGCTNTSIINCAIWNCSNGIFLSYTNSLGNAGNSISNNIIYDNAYGINFEHWTYYHYSNQISGNHILNNIHGIFMITALENEISFNIIENNTYGISIVMCTCGGGGNLIHHNSFFNNNEDGSDMGGNYWYLNYWDNYPGIDANHNGIGDTAYEDDRFPLMKPSTDPTLPFTAIFIVPEPRSLYYWGQRVCSFPMTFILGSTPIIFDVTTPLLLNKIDFSIGFSFKASFIERPYIYYWWNRSFFIYRIRITAYTYEGDLSHASLFVWKIF